jgi:hypothetical protein
MNTLWFALFTVFAQTASIQGVIVKDGNGEPLSKATVQLRAEASDVAPLDTRTTGEDGRFQFDNLRPGRYNLTVNRSGYVRPAMTVTVSNNQPQPVLQLPMKATGVIFGSVTDGKGEPLGNVEVQALKASYVDGRRVLSLVRSTQSNDIGEYRLFWLPAGRYYIEAIHPKAQDAITRLFRGGFGMTVFGGLNGGGNIFATGSPDPALDISLSLKPSASTEMTDRYLPVYFPGTLDEEAASAIDLPSGREVGGVNIVVGPVRPRHVKGVIINGATGRPAEYGSITLSDRPELLSNSEPAVDRETGAFDLVMMPGAHTLTANARSGEGIAVVHVGDADIENLVIPTLSALKVRSRISVENGAIKLTELGDLRLSLKRDPPLPAGRPGIYPQVSYSVPLDDGSFNLDGAVGDFRISIAPILNAGSSVPIKLPRNLQNLYVKSVRLGNVDVLNNGLHLEREPDAPLEVVLATNPAMIEGFVANDRRQPAGDIPVVLLPDNRRRFDLYFNTTTDPAGRFRLERIPPGSYRVFAWTDVEASSWYDPEFMRNYESQGVSIRIVDDATQETQLKAIP